MLLSWAPIGIFPGRAGDRSDGKRGARAYNGSLERSPQLGTGAERGVKPLKLKAFKHLCA